MRTQSAKATDTSSAKGIQKGSIKWLKVFFLLVPYKIGILIGGSNLGGILS